MRKCSIDVGSLMALLLLSFTAVGSPAVAQDGDGYWKDKQVRLIVGTAPGGGYDSYARLVAAHLPKHLPGKPSIVVQNMPGAGSLVLANHLSNVAPRDGTVIAAVHSLSAAYPLLFTDRAKYDGRELLWIGSTLRENHVGVAWANSSVHSFADVFNRELVIAGAGGATNTFPAFTNDVLGTRFKIVKGYEGTKHGMVAMERGEVSGVVGVSWSTLKATSPTWLAEGKIRTFVQFGLSKHPELPDVPWVFDFAKTSDDRGAMNLMFATQEFGRPYVAPPGLPETVIKMLRSGFESMMSDPDFRADADKRRLDLDITRGSDIQSIVDKIYQTPPAVVARVKLIVGDQLPQ